MRITVAAAVACLSVVGLSVAADVKAAIRTNISIPAGGLGPALRVLSEERRIHVVFISEDVSKLSTQGAGGSLTVDEALNQILNGTGLTFQYIDDETVSIVPIAAAPAATRATDASIGASGSSFSAFDETVNGPKGFWQSFRLAQVETSSRSEVQLASDNSSENSSKSRAIEEVVVTAQKRTERLRDVPISVSVLGGDRLDKSTTQGLREELERVPGVIVDVAGQGNRSNVTIRGVAAAGPNFFGGSTVAYYIDGSPFGFVRSASAPDVGVYDLDRVEVLRGPQGTLYGATALSGVLRVLTKDPDLEDFEVKARTSLSSTEGGGDNYRGDLALNIPLVEGALAARAIIGYQDLGGWIDKPNKKDANDEQIRNTRFKLRAQPAENLLIDASFWLSRSDQDAPPVTGGAVGSGIGPGRSAALLEEPTMTEYELSSLKVGYDFAAFSLTSTTSYLDYHNDGFLDGRGGQYPVFGAPPLATPHTLQSIFDSEIFTQEILASSSHGGSWRWSLGGLYRDGKDRTFQFRNNGVTYVQPAIWRDQSESVAVFGELTRLFFDGRIEATAGLRYFEDEVTLIEDLRLTGVPALPTPVTDTFDKLTKRFVLTWHPDDDATVYVSYAEGFRSGTQQLPVVVFQVPTIEPVGPDLLRNYELGAKTSFLDGRLNLDTAVFYIDWQGAQRNLSIEVLPQFFIAALVNAESVSGMGFEAALDARPIDDLRLGFTVGWNDLTFDENVRSGGNVLFPKGGRNPGSPEWTSGASADYSFPLGRGGDYTGRLSLSGNYTSGTVGYRIVDGVGLPVVARESLLIGRARFSIDAPEHWSVALYVENANNEQTASPDADTGGRAGRIRPRTIGVQFDYRL